MKLLGLFLLLALFAGAAFYGLSRDRGHAAAPSWRTTKVTKGEVVEGVQASGAVQPLVLVQVGSQISGTIVSLYEKDFNSRVVKGEPIALLDSSRLVAQVAQDRAALGRSRADVARVRAQLVQAERDLERQRRLAERRLVSEADLDAAVANADSLKAQLEVSAAVVSQSQAQLDGDQVNLDYATITSPVDGVIVSRNVDVGQTVAASLQAPTLYLIARDLTKVQVQASVPEAEIGKIHEGQRADFGVDAHPDTTFPGKVSQVRLASATVQNVVTYTVLVDADNPKGLLFPGMTASVTFEIARSRKDALRVPTTAIRFKPAEDQVEPEPAASPSPSPDGAAPAHGKGGKVYLKGREGKLRAVSVRLGVSDGVLVTVTPREPGALDEGTEVVIGISKEEEEAATNPFSMPRWQSSKKGSGH